MINWRHAWDQPIPPKVRVFLWHACHDLLPVRAELVRRHVSFDPSSPLRGVQVETMVHALFECRAVAFIWAEAPFILGRSFSL